jgi:hypothetical protein
MSTLSACNQNKERENPNDDYQIVYEFCMYNPNKKQDIRVEISTNTGFSDHSDYLEKYTVDNMGIFKGSLEHPQKLQSFSLEISATSSYLFKKDFTKYKKNEWSSWEKPNFLFKTGPNIPSFFRLSTSYEDGTEYLEKIPMSEQDNKARVRFKLMSFTEYLKTIIPTNKLIIKNDSPRCI